ncbi:hypothetical protein [Planctellipticum variicoloris]|uniref:hypothetical protein n=1 Tax=Planctellipticum variicoloris TaxID=3064265 RepID=UPI003013A3FC|nr:hypothetical protein SH412_004262 [Planctomycetaceae bacterium SH412]
MSDLLSCMIWAVVELLLAAADPAAATEPARVKRFDGLGTHGRAISTASPDAQESFNRGLAFLYAFNHDEAIRSFRQAAAIDPGAAMPHWGIAIANGPNINFPLVPEPKAKAAWEALQQAQKLSPAATPVERALIAALAKRYANPQPEDRRPLDGAYADAMRKVWEAHPDDADIGALYAEALMDLQPWNQWSPEGIANDGTDEVLMTLDRVLVLNPKHPLALHLYIHAVEASPSPEKAVEAADRLRELQPGLGHMVHMPSHIDVRLGKWQQAIEANEKAIAADAKYRKAQPEQDFYRNYMAHNYHMLAFAAMMQGQRQRSTHAIRVMLAEMPADWKQQNAMFVDGMHAMPYELALRFGQWDELLAEPEPAEHFPVARAVRLYARGVALAAKQQVAEARAEQVKFRTAKNALPTEAMFVLNTAADVLAIADQMLEGEILYREGKVDEALAALREAVRREDALRYIEPPDWIQPVRHALGATLMDARKFVEAEAVYRADLKKHPENGWSLFGLAESLRAQGKSAEADAVELRFKSAWQRADVQLTSSCYCLPGKK